MENKNLNPVDRLNDFNSRIKDFKKFKEVFSELDKSRQEKIINFFEKAPRKTRIINKFANKLIDLNKGGETEKIYIAIEQVTLSLNLEARNDLTQAEREGINQFINELPDKSQMKYLELLNKNLWHINEGKIPTTIYELKCLAAKDNLEEHKDSIKNFEEFSNIFDIRGIESKCEKDPTHKEFINEETINKVNKIFSRVRSGSKNVLANHIINLYENGNLKEISKYIEIKNVSLKLESIGFGNEDISKFKQTVNELNDKDAKLFLENLGDALKNNKSKREVMSFINKEAMEVGIKVGIKVQHHPLQIVNANKLQMQNPSKNTQLMDAI